MRMRFVSLFAVAISLIAADTAKIQRVENGLQPGIAIKGRPLTKMSIAERLTFYHVPGVSIAVVDGGKVDGLAATA